MSGESFEKGLRKLSTTMLEAATGSEDAARGFSAVGVEFKNQDGTLRATDQVLLDLAERFKAMPDGAEKTALAVQLFGKSGAELIPFLNQGRDGINELAAEMQALGVQMSSETAAQAGNFNDALDKLKLATQSIGNQIIASLLPALNDMAGGMVESAKQGGTLRAILDGVVLVLKTLALGAATVGKAFVALGEAIGAGVAAAVEALKGNTEGAKAIIADLKGNLVKRLDELASFRDSLFDPKPIEVKAPKIQADPELLQRLTKPKAAKPAQDTTGAQPGGDLSQSKEPLAYILRNLGYPQIGNWVAAAAIIALPSVILMMIFGQTRILFTMARDGLMPKAFTSVHSKYHTPHVVTIVTGVAVSLFAAMFPVDALADISNSGTLFAFFVVAIGVMILRVQQPNRPRPFRTPLVWIVGPTAVAGCALLFVSLGWYTIKLFLIWAAIGIVVYFAYARSRSVLAHGERK